MYAFQLLTGSQTFDCANAYRYNCQNSSEDLQDWTAFAPLEKGEMSKYAFRSTPHWCISNLWLIIITAENTCWKFIWVLVHEVQLELILLQVGLGQVRRFTCGSRLHNGQLSWIPSPWLGMWYMRKLSTTIWTPEWCTQISWSSFHLSFSLFEFPAEFDRLPNCFLMGLFATK